MSQVVSHSRSDGRSQSSILSMGIAALSVIFLWQTVELARISELDMDEVLAVWTARLPTSRDVIAAIWKGAEYSPPTYDLLLHGIFEVFGYSPLFARLPSLVATLCSAILVAQIVSKRLGAYPALVAFGLVLNSKLFDYAVQARPYALWAAFAMFAVWLWQREEGQPRIANALLLSAALFVCFSLHFYAFLTLGALMAMEAIQTVRLRQVRFAFWLAFLAAGIGAVLVWSPLAAHLAAFNSVDTQASSFYGLPTLENLCTYIFDLFFGARGNLILLLVAFCLISGSAVVFGSSHPASYDRDQETKTLTVIALALVTILPVGFVVAVTVTHVFSARYALGVIPGFAILMAIGVNRVSAPRTVCAGLFLTLCLLTTLRGPPPSTSLSQQAMRLLRTTPEGPVAIGDGWLFIVMYDQADPALRARLVYLTAPDGAQMGDSVNERQIERLKTIFPDLPLTKTESFVASTSSFTHLCRPGIPADFTCGWLYAHQRDPKLLVLEPGMALFKFSRDDNHASS